MADAPLPPAEAHTSTDGFLAYVEEHGDDKLPRYLRLLVDDYENDRLSGSSRHFTIEEVPEDGMDIGRIIDLAVMFGMVWEREDPWRPDDE